MSENKRYYEGCEKLEDGRYRIRENMQVTPIKCNEPITEKIMVEGKEISPKRKYTFLVWKKDKTYRDGSGRNGNLRNYSDVIDLVIKENRPTFSLADHPLDGCDADSTRISGCAKNYRMINGWMACDWFPLGELGNKIAEGYELGVPATISSSVLGECDDDGYVLATESFFLERAMDNLIDFPSNGIFHYKDHVDKIGDEDYKFTTISEKGLNESKDTTSASLTENKEDENLSTDKTLTIIDNNIDVTDKSEKPQNDKSDEIESNVKGEDRMPENEELLQQSMMLNVKSLVKDADKIESPFERKDALVSADCFAQKLVDKTIHDEISKKIEDAENEIKELSKKGLETDGLTAKVKSLEDENTALKAEIEALKKTATETEGKLKTITDMYEEEQYKASEAEIEKNDELTEKNHRLSRELASIKAKNRNLECLVRKTEKINESKIKKLEAETNTMADVETVLALKKKIKSLEDEIECLEDELDACKKVNKRLEAEANTAIDTEDVVALKEKISALTAKNNRLMRSLNEARMEKKASRFATLKKTMEEDDDETVVTDDIIEDEIEDDEVTVDNGEVVVERDEDSIMEKLLSHNY